LFQESAPKNQFSHFIESLRKQSIELSDIGYDEDSRKEAIRQKFTSQFSTTMSEDYQFATFKDMIDSFKELDSL
jgi:hypothetical protein